MQVQLECLLLYWIWNMGSWFRDWYMSRLKKYAH